MKKQLLLIIVLCFALSSCNHWRGQKDNSKDIIISPKLGQALSNFINEHKNEDGDKIYVLRFDKKGDKYYVTISQSFDYDKRYVDAYFFLNKELVITYFLDSIKGINVIKKENMIKFKDSIPNYKEVSQNNSFYETYPLKYKIISSDSLELIPDTYPIQY